MEDWLYYSLSIAFCLALFLLSSLRPDTGTPAAAASLPPGPTALMTIGPLLLLGGTSFGVELIIRTTRSWYGSIFTIYFLPTPAIFVADRAVARRVLVQRGAAFADRPPANLPARIFTSNQHTISSAAYGPLWRVLRRNLAVKVLHPSRLRRHDVAGLVAGVAQQMRGEGVVVIEELLHRAMFDVAVVMCFGDVHGDAVVASVTALQRELVTSVVGFQVFGAAPAITKLLFRRRLKRMLSIRRRQEELFAPLIRARARRARRDAAAGELGDGNFAEEDCYADSLLDLRIPEDGGSRNLTESEMVCLCAEFLTNTTDSTAAVMQWIMANLVAQPEIQAKLLAEIRHVVAGAGEDGVEDEHLRRMPYLRAVVLEGLRRHPPTHFTVPHAAAEEAGTTLDGFSVPRHVAVNFTLADMGLDEAVWPDARRFRPERFLPGDEGEGLDLTGGREIKMMPFGAGRRMCPGVELELLHLEYFVANLVREFEWKEAPGEPVEFAERREMSLVMKRPLRAIAVPYANTSCT